MKWVRNMAHMEEKRNAYMVLVRKPEGKRPLGRPRHIWDNINFYHVTDHLLVSKICWQMAQCTTCWSLCVYLVAT
jgi:hypothetical protein